MLPGPVFAVELLTTARRARYYALRTFYGLVLLAIFWASYTAYQRSLLFNRLVYPPGGRFPVLVEPGPPGEVSAGEMARFARETFFWFAGTQALTVLLITPSLVGGTIASEKRRKTLHYLLASQLSSGEIVLGKLLARMLMVFVYLAAAVPLMFLLRLFGGVELGLIFATFAATATFAMFLASLAIFFSTFMARARTAITATYLTLFGLVIVPVIMDYFIMIFFRRSTSRGSGPPCGG